MGETCSPHETENQKDKNYFEGLDVEGRIILKWILNNKIRRCSHWGLVNATRNIRVP